MVVSTTSFGVEMNFTKFATLLLALAFIGCEAKKAPEPQGPVQKKSTKEANKGNIATVNEPA
jgi:hypothetical protein